MLPVSPPSDLTAAPEVVPSSSIPSPPTGLRVPAGLIPPNVSSARSDALPALDAAPVATGYKAGVELVERRTEKSKTFTGDRPGQLKTELYAGVKHYKDAKGNWVDIDADLGASRDGKRHNKANSFDLAIADSAADAALASVTLDASHAVSFALDGAAKVQGKADKSTVTYANTHRDTDVRLTSVPLGVKEELVLRSPAAPW